MTTTCMLCNKTDEELGGTGVGLYVNSLNRGVCDTCIDAVIKFRGKKNIPQTMSLSNRDLNINRLLLGLADKVNSIQFASQSPKYTPKRVRMVKDSWVQQGIWENESNGFHEHIKRLNNAYGHEFGFEVEV